MGSNGRNGNRAHLEIVSFEEDATETGFMVFPGAPPKETKVSRSFENDHLFLYHTARERFETIRYGSALIVSMLKLFEPGNSNSNNRRLALFDTGGNFHNNLVLRDPLYPNEADVGIPHIKHVAIFDKGVETVEGSLAILIDDIHVMSLAKPPIREP